MKAVLAGVLFAMLVVEAAEAEQWVDGAGRSCDDACRSVGDTAYSTSTHPNGHPYFVCRTTPHGDGRRAGYNLRPNWANACIVGYDGKEYFSTSFYQCLCANYPRP